MDVKEKDYDVTFRDPQAVLRKYHKNDNLTVSKFDFEPFTTVGDNYGSTMLKVRVIIRENDTSDDERELNFVAKLLPPTKIQRAIFNSSYTFKKEIFLYEHLIPTYARCYESVFDDKFDVTPAYCGSRLSLNDESCDVDENAVILLENLKLNGYYMWNRHEGMLVDEVKSAITALAKFHAVGFVVKKEDPLFMEKCKLYSKPLNEIKDRRIKILGPIMDAIRADTEMSRYADRIDSSVDASSIYGTSLDPEHRFAITTHRDYWGNNVVIRRNKFGKIDKAKMLDFQTYSFNSCLTDVLFLLCTSMAMLQDHFDEVIEFYRQSMIGILEKFDHDASLFENHQFEERLKVDAKSELAHIFFISRAIQKRDGEDVKKEPPNEYYMARVREIIEIYVEKNWI